nr:cysteine-rich atrial secretory protein [Ambigolimax valentianus]
MMFLNAAAVFVCALVQLSAGCAYTNCVFAGLPRSSGVEHFVVKMNFDQIPTGVASQCATLLRRSTSCRSRYVGCPRTRTRSYIQRFDDPAYVRFIMDLGDYICRNLDVIWPLKACITGSFKSSLQQYSFDDGYNVNCLRSTFSASQACPQAAKRTFLNLLNSRLTNNPFQSHASSSTCTSGK